LLAHFLADKGLLFVEPLDARWHALAAPLYRSAIEHGKEFVEALLARGRQLERAGYHAQVKLADSNTLLFVRVNGQRVALRRRGDDFQAAGQSFSRAELLEWLASAPEDFSANALLRPVVQDFLLPTAAIVAGPAEIAYLAQSSVLYERLDVRMPAVLPRAGYTLVEPNVARTLKKYGLPVEAVLTHGAGIRRRIEQQALPTALAMQFDTGEKELQKCLHTLRKLLRRLDSTLLGAAETAERKMMFQLLKLRAKAGRARDFRRGVLDRHVRLILDSLLPRGTLQERSLNLLPFLARHGVELLDVLQQRASPFPPAHHIVEL
jgi:bacillithiol biosynthesis cysteine-adding enzyme BshC